MITLLLSACNGVGDRATPAGAATIDGEAYELEALPGSLDIQRAIRRDAQGNVLESGFIRDSVKTGTWQINRTDGEFPEKIISFVNGRYNGPYIEFNERGQIALMATYKDNVLHGPWGIYRFGRAEKTATYVDGEIEGVYKEYDYRNGNLKKEVNYKQGKEDGLMRFYDDNGDVIMEYTYRNGEKVSGGVVEPQAGGEE